MPALARANEALVAALVFTLSIVPGRSTVATGEPPPTAVAPQP